MRLDDAKKFIDDGFRLQRTSWPSRDEYVYRSGKTVLHRCASGCLEAYVPSEDDEQARDWELVR